VISVGMKWVLEIPTLPS